jgi:mycothiol synthase
MSILARPYTDNDLPHLQAALASWIQEAGDCGYCHIGELRHHIYSDGSIFSGILPIGELVQIWEDESGIVGIAINLRFDNAFEVFTSPKYRGTDDELKMLETAAETALRLMKQRERKETSVIIDVWDTDATRIKLLTQLGFAEYRVWGYYEERSIAVPISEPVLPEGFTIRGSTLADYAQLAAVHNSAFGVNWKPEEYRDEMMLKPGYDPEREMVVVAPDGQFAAFTIMWLDTLNKVGLFEPVGTHRDFHRKGLGKALMLHVLHKMKAHGMETALVGHDAENLPATALYTSIGFIRKHTTLGYERK